MSSLLMLDTNALSAVTTNWAPALSVPPLMVTADRFHAPPEISPVLVNVPERFPVEPVALSVPLLVPVPLKIRTLPPEALIAPLLLHVPLA